MQQEGFLKVLRLVTSSLELIREHKLTVQQSQRKQAVSLRVKWHQTTYYLALLGGFYNTAELKHLAQVHSRPSLTPSLSCLTPRPTLNVVSMLHELPM